MIIEQCNKLEEKFNKYEERKRRENDAQSLKVYKLTLKEKKEVLSTIIERISLLKNNKLLTSKDLPDSNKAIERLSMVHSNFKNDPLNISKGRDFSLLIKYLEQLCESLSEKFTVKWKQWVNDQSQSTIDDDLLKLFGSVTNFQESINQIISLKKTINQYRNNLPSSQDDFMNFKSNIEKIRGLIDSLPLKDIPEDVQKFLKALNTPGGAGLDLLTEAVIEWLQQNNLFSNYCIKPTSRGSHFV